jgi:hypothetical protein
MPEPGDVWWNLDHEPDALASGVAEALQREGLPFLDGFSSREAILQGWYRDGNAIGFPPRGQLSVALMHWHRGERDLAERLIGDYLDTDIPPGHADFVRAVARQLGLALAAD